MGRVAELHQEILEAEEQLNARLTAAEVMGQPDPFEEEIRRADREEGYSPEHWAHDAIEPLAGVLRYAERLTDRQLEVLIEAKIIVKELANG